MRTHRLLRPENAEAIFGQGTFSILSIEEVRRAVSLSVPNCTYGMAFAEGSGSRKVYTSGNDDELSAAAGKELLEIGAGHTFLVFLRGAFPIQVLPNLKATPTVLRIFAATSNPLIVLLHDEGEHVAVIGVADGYHPNAIEEVGDVSRRQSVVRRVGYLEPFED